MISIKKIYKTIQGYPILKDINCDIPAHKLTAIVGPSGSGKTTLLQLIGGLDTPSQGSIHVDGTSINELTHPQLAEFRNTYFGYVFQQYHLISRLTAIDNVSLPLIQRYWTSAQARQPAVDILTRCGLSDHLQQISETLSSGQQQRVALARALIGKPQIILADEPTGALDTHHSEIIFNMLRELTKQKITVVLITHDKDIAAKADTVIHMNDGEINAIS